MAQGTCSIGSCDREATRRGWCHLHYQRWLNHGDPQVVLRLGGPAAHPKVDDAEWLRQRYVDDGLTTSEIATELGCGQPTVWRALNRLGIETRSKAPVRHGQSTRQRKTRTYMSWQAMIQRCTNPTNIGWPRYGGRGITVCDRWLTSFENFLADMGERPPKMTNDRIDNDGNYEPGNCRWATQTEQNRHRERDAIGKYV